MKKTKKESRTSKVVRGQVRLLKDGYVMIKLGQLAFVAPASQVRVMRLHRYEHVRRYNSITAHLRERLISIYEMRREGNREVPRIAGLRGEQTGREQYREDWLKTVLRDGRVLAVQAGGPGLGRT
jgi:hypothetical protein